MQFRETLNESKRNKLLLLDVDDTIVKAKNIYIYKKTKNGEVKLTPDEYAEENVEDQGLYDFREFRNAEKLSQSIKTGDPIIPVLNFMDRMIGKGYDVGILTARAQEDVIRNTLQSWLMYKKRDKLRNIGNKLKAVFAINDQIKKYEGATIFDKKANVIKNLSKQYDKIIFIDDDKKNVEAVKRLNLQNVKVKSVEEIIS